MIKQDGLEIFFDNGWSAIAVSASGGADSTLLAYILCNHIQKNKLENIIVHMISHIRCWKTKPWQANDAKIIWLNFVKEFPSIKFERHVNFIAPDLEWADKGPILTDEYGKSVSGDNIQIRSYAEYICYQHNIDAYYNAVTRNPRVDEFQGMSTRDIEPAEDNKHLAIMKHMGKWAIHPFRFTEKNWVYKQYKDLNLLWLWEKTRSCEGTFADLDYRNYHPDQSKVPTCGECFWCKEREWAIKNVK